MKKLSLLLVFALLMTCVISAAAEDTINILLEEVNDTYKVMEFIDEFEAQTGIKANVEIITYSAMHEKLIPQLMSAEGTGSYDVIVVDKQWVGEFVCGDWLLPLDEFIARDGFDTSVYIPAMFDMVGQVNGTTYMLPFYNYTTGMMYRKDIFEDPEVQAAYKEKTGKELVVPTTVPEFVETAIGLTTRDADGNLILSGTIGQFRRSSVQFEHSIFMYGLGSTHYDENWKAAVNGEAGVGACQAMVDMYKECMPEGATSYSMSEKAAYLSEGKAAMAVEYPTTFMQLSQDEYDLHDSWEFIVSPGGAGAQGGWGWAIPRSSAKQEQAWEFLKWVESNEIAVKRALIGGQPTRSDVFELDEVREKFPEQKTAYERIAGAKALPIICSSAQVPEIMNLYVSSALAGEMTCQEAMNAAAAELDELIIGDPIVNK